jgi:pimeloyl-ACP methyl ester carboxylesterase
MADNLYQPAISYWPLTGQDVNTPDLTDLMKAITTTKVVLMIHGYNNDQLQASASYTNFLAHLRVQGRVTANLVGIYWPGANWEGALYYMQALGQAKKTAPVLASNLYQIAQAKGYLQIDIVTHSLGGRLALETIKEILLLRQQGPSPLVIGKITMMAGAVPVSYLEQTAELQPTLPAFQGTQSLYSLQDLVLHWAFPPGETAAGEGFFPTALGRNKWPESSQYAPGMDQQENKKANHGDYWGPESSTNRTETFAATEVYNFLSIGTTVSRATPARTVAAAIPLNPRTTLSARTI